MNNMIFPPADAKPAEIANALFVAITQHQAYHDAAVHVVDLLHPLNLHTLQFLRAKFKESNLRHQHPKGPDFEQGENYAFARIDEVLANAIELAGGPDVRPEPEIPWDKLPDWAQWVAMDETGCWFLYEVKPRKLITCWGLVSGKCMASDIIPISGPDWRASLRQRPKPTDQ